MLPPSLREPILGMAEDGRGFVWVATANGVLRVDREKLLRGDFSDGDVREYGLPMAWAALEGVKRHRTLVADPRGRIWFSIGRGLSMVDPTQAGGALDAGDRPCRGHFGRRHPSVSPRRRAAGRRRLTFAYAGLSLSVPERVDFRYRLDGFDRDWSAAVAERAGRLYQPRARTVSVSRMASNSDGLWNGAEAAVRFEIAPLFWQTTWFRVASVALCVGAAGASIACACCQVARGLNVRFEERLAERTRIAQDLHDTLLQGFVSASMQLHVAADRVARGFAGAAGARARARAHVHASSTRDATPSAACARRRLPMAIWSRRSAGVQQELASPRPSSSA